MYMYSAIFYTTENQAVYAARHTINFTGIANYIMYNNGTYSLF